jgi:hypothetical protein
LDLASGDLLMKIGLAVHGGLAAGMRLGRPARTLDVDALPAAEKAKLADLIAAAEREAASGEARESRGADLQSYTISIERADGPLELRVSDSTMTPAFGALLDAIQNHLRGR